MNKYKYTNCVTGIVGLFVTLCLTLAADTIENSTDHICVTYERKVINVSTTIKVTEPQTISSICKLDNRTFGTCDKNTTQVETKVIFSEKIETVPIENCCPGYQKKNAVCQPICTTECENGTCVGPDKCECNDGFMHDKNEAYRCNPVCNGCEYGMCISPNSCKCSVGYQWKTIENKCIPICTMNCPNGECIAPDNCTCNENYYFNETLSSCEPNCHGGCNFGICIGPNNCTCNDGYQLKNGSFNECEPICAPQCVNGTCIAPNKCECSDGFMHKNGSFNGCEPICSPECENGECIEPNECKCNNDYKKSNRSIGAHFCCPICRSAEDCINGMCMASGNCNCIESFRLSPGDNNTNALKNFSTRITRQDQFDFNWGHLMICLTFLLAIAILTIISIWMYRNRMISYRMGSKTNYAFQYSTNNDDTIHIFQ